MLLYVLELIGVAVFAVSGALAAGRKSLDLIGVMVLALVTAVGGGTIRDLLLDHPPVWLADPMYLLVVIASAYATMLYVRWRPPPEKTLLVFDALGLALFSVAGARIAQNAGLPVVSCIALGMVTGAFGGVVRDVLTAEIPLIFRPGALYASAAIAGTTSYFVLDALDVSRQAAAITGIAVVATVRLAAIWWGLRLPVFQLEQNQQGGAK